MSIKENETIDEETEFAQIRKHPEAIRPYSKFDLEEDLMMKEIDEKRKAEGKVKRYVDENTGIAYWM